MFKQRLFTVLLGVLFATALTDQASALYDPGVGRFCSRDPIGYVDGQNLFEASLFVSFVDPTGHMSYLEVPTFDTLSRWMAHCAKAPTLVERIKCLEVMAGNKRIDDEIARLRRELLPKGPAPKPSIPPAPQPAPPAPAPPPIPGLPQLTEPLPPKVPSPAPNPVPTPLPNPWSSCSVCLESFPLPFNIVLCMPLCCVEELKKDKGECPKCICKKPSGSNEFYYTFKTKYSCENFPSTEKGISEGLVSCKCGT